MSNKTFLINQFMDYQNQFSYLKKKIDKLELDFHNERLTDATAHQLFIELPADLSIVARAMAKMEELWASTYKSEGLNMKGSYHYGYTIGSDEKESPATVMKLYRRFINSADFKNPISQEWYFEKGKEGYIHLHGIAEFAHRQKRSVNDLSTRYGKLNGKQYNFFNKRLKYSLDVIKWKKYIKKDQFAETHETHKKLLIE